MKFASILLLTALSPIAAADWSLDSQNAHLDFVSIKKSSIAEVHHFKRLQGHITATGEATLSVDLTSVDTAIPVRDERMQKMLFETAQFPTLTLSARIPVGHINGMAAGSMSDLDIVAELDLHGVKASVKANVRVCKLSADRLLVTSNKPVIINAADFQLTGGIEKLKTVAELPSISTAVPVTFSLVFQQ